MKVMKTEFNEVNREYLLTSKELKRKLGITGQVINIGLYTGRSPNDVEQGVSVDNDVWYITTQERGQEDD